MDIIDLSYYNNRFVALKLSCGTSACGLMWLDKYQYLLKSAQIMDNSFNMTDCSRKHQQTTLEFLTKQYKEICEDILRRPAAKKIKDAYGLIKGIQEVYAVEDYEISPSQVTLIRKIHIDLPYYESKKRGEK